MSKADAFYHYRNEQFGIFSLTSREREDMAWTIKHYGLEECKRAYYDAFTLARTAPKNNKFSIEKEVVNHLLALC